ncbi:MAG: winged helix-turn-helix domain-containing protein [bacterium]|nr:winged helix-turn-helix domain-containing protein [bacterium]
MFDQVKERALQITEALYRTTELFSDAEPLKWSLRQNALDVLNSSPQDLGRVEGLVKSLFLKLELAASGTFISKMNFDVLKREYSNLLSSVMSYKNSYQALLDNIARPAVIGQARPNETVRVSDKPKQIARPIEAAYKAEGGKRRETILTALKEKGPSSVGDLAGIFGENISEKTVQRELSALVNTGAVKKEGEKRWRRYYV